MDQAATQALRGETLDIFLRDTEALIEQEQEANVTPHLLQATLVSHLGNHLYRVDNLDQLGTLFNLWLFANDVDAALDLLDTCAIEELLPPELSQGMMTLPEALRTLHRPPPTLQLSDLETGQHPAQRRLILEELLHAPATKLAGRQADVVDHQQGNFVHRSAVAVR